MTLRKTVHKALPNIFFVLSVLYMEMVVRVYCFGSPLQRGFLLVVLFSLSYGAFFTFASAFGSVRFRRIIAALFILLLTLLYSLQAAYYGTFQTFTTLYSVFIGTGEVIHDFWPEVFSTVLRSVVPILLCCIPAILFFIFKKNIVTDTRMHLRWALPILAAIIVPYALCLLLVKTATGGIMTDDFVYSRTFSPVLSVPRFGVLTTLRLDVENMVETVYDREGTEASSAALPVSAPNLADPSKYNVMHPDLSATTSELAVLNASVASTAPTSKNAYTGMFKGYNLIWIVAESFSRYALDETHTPTLCKLADHGFVFRNFYNPIWYVSTLDGEYVTTTGLLPESGAWSYYKSAKDYMPFAFGTQFGQLGYSANAYHDHTYNYYHRDVIYPNMGYTFKAQGKGLSLTEQWPESDVEMVDATAPDFLQNDHFMVYYLTVSGHLNYNFEQNAMAKKHESEVSDLPYSEPAKAYVACQMELDQAVAALLDDLQKAGKLDNTVIALSGDHYPYALTKTELEELNHAPIEQDFELYRSTFILWNSKLGTIPVDQYCSSTDIMPTLANLFGLDYDSRLVVGKDILSDPDPLVIFNNRSYISKYGRYNSLTDTFSPNPGATVPAGYAQSMLEAVEDKFKYSAEVLDSNYYAAVFQHSS